MAFNLNVGQKKAREVLVGIGARFFLLVGGSRSGKTAFDVSCIIDRAMNAPSSRHLIVRKEGSAAKRAIVKDTFPKTWEMKFGKECEKPKFKEIYGYFPLFNGSEIWVGGLNDEKAMERILGNEYATIYMNEASECSYSSFLLLKTRLAQVAKTLSGAALIQRFFVDLNPTVDAHWTHKLWLEGIEPQDGKLIDKSKYSHIFINPMDNKENLTQEYLDDLDSLPERQRKRFRDGVYSSDDENALWRRSFIKYENVLPDMVRVVVAIDPAISNDIGSDETGIVVMGLGADGKGYVLADESGKFRPEEWARRAISAYHTYDADRIVAEINQGGAMVEATIKAQQRANEFIPYKGVHATRGKEIRAEPIAALYEVGKIKHAQEFTTLEDQLCSFTIGFDRKKQGYSPDRMDATVWAATELFPQIVNKKEVTRVETVPRANPMSRR